MPGPYGGASATLSAVRGIESRRASAPWPRDDRSDSGRGAVSNKELRLSFFTAVRTPLSMQRARHSCSGGSHPTMATRAPSPPWLRHTGSWRSACSRCWHWQKTAGNGTGRRRQLDVR
jgi:hypothetical protein